MAAAYGFADCTTLHCPRLDGPRPSLSVPKSQLLCDIRGHYWCQQCARRCELMNWAHERHWPAVRVQGKSRYAVYGDAEEWFSSVMAASQDMIDALYETLIEQKRAQLDLKDYSDGVKSVEKWLDTIDD